MSRLMIVSMVVLVLTALAVPALAEHLTLMTPDEGVPPPTRLSPAISGSTDLDVDLKLGGGGFRFGARLFGAENVYGAWLNGQTRPDGFAIDGRVQGGGGRAFNFKFDAGLLDPSIRAAWSWRVGGSESGPREAAP